MDRPPADCSSYDFACLWVRVLSVRDCTAVTGSLTSLHELGEPDETVEVSLPAVRAGSVFELHVTGTSRIEQPDLTCVTE